MEGAGDWTGLERPRWHLPAWYKESWKPGLAFPLSLRDSVW